MTPTIDSILAEGKPLTPEDCAWLCVRWQYVPGARDVACQKSVFSRRMGLSFTADDLGMCCEAPNLNRLVDAMLAEREKERIQHG